MKERLQALMREENLTALRLAEILEVQPSSISHLIAGRNNPNFDFVVKVLTRFPEIDPDWFIMGRGEMFRHQAPVSAEKSVPLSLFEEAPGERSAELPTPPAVFSATEGKQTEKIILLYSDRTFDIYKCK